jgi:hypothetical protein
MGIPAPLAEFFLAEHKFRPLSGKMLSLGRQTILFEEEVLGRLLDAHSVSRLSSVVEIDQLTTEARQSPETRFITDESFFAAFSDAQYDVLDVSDYEGATIVHDLCKPLPEELAGRFDFIFNGSVLDNIFDPAGALRNISRMLAPNGRVMHIEMASNLAFEYLTYSPDWFLDYYVANRFSDCKIYVCTFRDVDELKYGPWRVFNYSPRSGAGCSLREVVTEHAVLVVVAEKKADSTWDESPIQWCYRGEAEKSAFLQSFAQFDASRPLTKFGERKGDVLQPEVGGYIDCGTTMLRRA